MQQVPLCVKMWQPDPTRPTSAGRLIVAPENICVVTAVAEAIQRVHTDTKVTWSSYRQPNPGEKQPVELVVATDPKGSLTARDAIRAGATDLIKRVRIYLDHVKMLQQEKSKVITSAMAT